MRPKGPKEETADPLEGPGITGAGFITTLILR